MGTFRHVGEHDRPKIWSALYTARDRDAAWSMSDRVGVIALDASSAIRKVERWALKRYRALPGFKKGNGLRGLRVTVNELNVIGTYVGVIR